jgi:Domain of unknown function (DUF4908)
MTKGLVAAPQEGRHEEGPVRSLNRLRTLAAMILLAAATGPVLAQGAVASGQGASGDPMTTRLSAEKVGDVETGDFSTDNNLTFSLAPYGDRYLLRFANSPEDYVLTVERILLGGRVLRYDTGVTALRVSVWGGMTLYTESAPGGLPATRVGDDESGPPPPVSHNDFVAALSDEESHLAYTRQLHLRFSADPKVLAGTDDNRRLAFDAMISAEAGIERLLGAPTGKDALSRKFDMVRIVQGEKPGITMSGKTLMVTYAPVEGAIGRASSRAVAVQLGKMLQIAEAG